MIPRDISLYISYNLTNTIQVLILNVSTLVILGVPSDVVAEERQCRLYEIASAHSKRNVAETTLRIKYPALLSISSKVRNTQ